MQLEVKIEGKREVEVHLVLVIRCALVRLLPTVHLVRLHHHPLLQDPQY